MLAVEMKNVCKTFRGRDTETLALDNVNLAIEQNDIVTLIGPSGSGKSTCLRTINGLESISSGEIRLFGEPYNTSKTATKIRRNTSMIFQKFELFPHLTARENIALAPHLRLGKSKQEAMALAEDLLKMVGLLPHGSKYPRMLSGGQQQRVAIARALAVQPKILLCDEPTSALDPELVDDVLELLTSVANTGMTMVIVTHEIRFARRVSKKCNFFDGGRLVESGSTEELLSNPQSERLKAFLSSLKN